MMMIWSLRNFGKLPICLCKCMCGLWEKKNHPLHFKLFSYYPKKITWAVGMKEGCACLLSPFSHVWLFVTPRTVACQTPLSMGLPRQEYWSGLPFPSPGDLSDTGIELVSPALQADSWSLSQLGSPLRWLYVWKSQLAELQKGSKKPHHGWDCGSHWLSDKTSKVSTNCKAL